MENPEQRLENYEGNEEERAKAVEALNLDPSLSWDEIGEAYFRFNLAQEYSPSNKLEKEEIEKAKEEYLEKWNDPSFREEEYARHGHMGERIRNAEEQNEEKSNEKPSNELEKEPEEKTEKDEDESPKPEKPVQNKQETSKEKEHRENLAKNLGYIDENAEEKIKDEWSWEKILNKRAEELDINPKELKSGHEWPAINSEILKKLNLNMEDLKSSSMNLEDFNVPVDWINKLEEGIKKGEVKSSQESHKWLINTLSKLNFSYEAPMAEGFGSGGIRTNGWEIKKIARKKK